MLRTFAPRPSESYGDRTIRNLESWLTAGRGPDSPISSIASGIAGAALTVSLGALLKGHAGGGEPLIAVFPILMVACLRWGNLAGGLTLLGGLAGAWYIYLGQPFSFVVNSNEMRGLITAFVAGAFMIGICAWLRISITRLQLIHAELEALAQGLSDRALTLDDANASLSDALIARVEAQDALAMSEAQFRASFESAAVGKVQSDPFTGKIIRANGAFANMIGYEPHELVGRLGWDFTRIEEREADQAEYREVLEGRKPVYLREKRYLVRGGAEVWARASSTIVLSPKTGEPVLTVSVVENIDDQHRASIALQAAKQELETLLEERTVTLGQRDLLLGEVYHRVKNNLQMVDSLLVMQRHHLTDPDAKEALSALRSRVFALGLVHQQLMRSQDLRTFDIATFLEDLGRNLVLGGASRGVRLEVKSLPLKVGLDFAIPLGLVMTELVTNALKHAFPHGTGMIQVSLDRTESGSIALVVSDNGAASADAVIKGSNSLGLSIVDALVAQLGGTLSVDRHHGFRSEVQISELVAK